MLEGVDPDTGERLDQENIRYQMITFLIAGHETTSGLLSFAIYYLLKNPDKLHKAVSEVERVLKDPVPTYSQVRELKYVRMVLSESRVYGQLRLPSRYMRRKIRQSEEPIRFRRGQRNGPDSGTA